MAAWQGEGKGDNRQFPGFASDRLRATGQDFAPEWRNFDGRIRPGRRHDAPIKRILAFDVLQPFISVIRIFITFLANLIIFGGDDIGGSGLSGDTENNSMLSFEVF